jgi:SAM-dependent methyltransferase
MDKNTFYSGYFQSHQGRNEELSGKNLRIVQYLKANHPEVGALLDIGCLNSPLMKAIPQALRVRRYCGVDLLPVPEQDLQGIEYQPCDIDKEFPFADVKFDVILCSEVIEHLFAPDRVFEFAASHLGGQGILVLTTPNLASWYNRVALLLGYQPCHTEVSVRFNVGKITRKWEGEVGGHLRVFTLRALIELAGKYGLRAAFKGSVSVGGGVFGVISRVLSPFPSLGQTLFCVFEQRKEVLNRR